MRFKLVANSILFSCIILSNSCGKKSDSATKDGNSNQKPIASGDGSAAQNSPKSESGGTSNTKNEPTAIVTMGIGEMKVEDNGEYCVTQFWYVNSLPDESNIEYYEAYAYGFVDKLMGNNTSLGPSRIYPSKTSNLGFDTRTNWEKKDNRYRSSYTGGCMSRGDGSGPTPAERAKTKADILQRFAGATMEVRVVFKSSFAGIDLKSIPTATECQNACTFVSCVPGSALAKVCSPTKKSFLYYHIEGRCEWKNPSDGECK